MKVKELKLGQAYSDSFGKMVTIKRGGFLNLFKVAYRFNILDNGEAQLIETPVYNDQYIKLETRV